MPAIKKVRIITSGPSNGATALAERLNSFPNINVSKVRVGTPKTQPRTNIKWGCFQMQLADYGMGDIINGSASDITLNKLTCFQSLERAGIPVPEFTDDLQTATNWLRNGCRRVYQRNLLRGSEGDGIVVSEANQEGVMIEGSPELTQAPLYTKGLFGVRREYRIHVVQCDGIRRVFIQQKKRRTSEVEATTHETRIRNLANGWIFAHNEIVPPRQQTIDIAVHAIRSFNLEFGAVDLIEMDDVTKGSFVLEINCAPGLQGATLDFYANAFKGILFEEVDEVEQNDDEFIPEEPEYDDEVEW